MKSLPAALAVLILLLGFVALGAKDEKPVRLPSGKLQQDEILKAEHKKSLDDMNRLIELAEELRQELRENEHLVLSIPSLKKAEEIEKLAKKVRNRIRR